MQCQVVIGAKIKVWDIKCQGEGRVITLYGIMEGLTSKMTYEQTCEGTEPCKYLECDIVNSQHLASCSIKRLSLNLGWLCNLF